MKRLFVFVLILVGLTVRVHGQDFGLSFSYFIPKNGYFSTPISPFSIRGLGVDLNRYFALETGASLYRMSGLNMKDLPFDSKSPLVGPNFTLFVPAELVIQLQGTQVSLDLKGGGFFFYGFDQKINYGNFDRAIRDYEGWAVANATFTAKNKPGFGVHGGAELTFYVNNQLGISIECNYLMGSSDYPIKGSYIGGNDALTIKEVSYDDAKIDFTGLEFSLGLIFSSGGGNAPKRPKRGRRR